MSRFIFQPLEPSAEASWRSIVLFGQNVASYKFALARTLLELAAQERAEVSLEELARPFARHICTHLAGADKQGTSGASRFLDSCRAFNRGEIDEDTLAVTTARLGFVNVIDAFHVVAGEKTPIRFFSDERKRSLRGLRLSDELLALPHGEQGQNLPSEAEARWSLVETAWALQVPRVTLAVSYEPENGLLVARSAERRRAVTQARDALNGYQRGHCFYCFATISVIAGAEDLGQVDHFLPHSLRARGIPIEVDQIWNLVLACAECNSWHAKSDRIPDPTYLPRLHRRNEWLLASHLPLRGTLIRQTGATEHDRGCFLQDTYATAREHMPITWSTQPRGPDLF